MIGMRSTDEETEELIKLLPAVSFHGTTDAPHHTEQEQTLKPQSDLKEIKQINNPE